MKTIKSQIPDSLYKQVKSLAERESISIDQLVSLTRAQTMKILQAAIQSLKRRES